MFWRKGERLHCSLLVNLRNRNLSALVKGYERKWDQSSHWSVQVTTGLCHIQIGGLWIPSMRAKSLIPPHFWTSFLMPLIQVVHQLGQKQSGGGQYSAEVSILSSEPRCCRLELWLRIFLNKKINDIAKLINSYAHLRMRVDSAIKLNSWSSPTSID